MKSLPVTNMQTYQDVSFVCKRVVSLLCDEKQLVKEEEGALILGPLDAEGSFKDQFPVAGQVWPLPVREQTLNLLKKRKSHEIKQEVGRQGSEGEVARLFSLENGI